MADTRLQAPPVTHQMVNIGSTFTSGFLTRRWGTWLQSLYSKLGGSNALGTFEISTIIDDIHTPTTTFIAIPYNCRLRKGLMTVDDTITLLDESVDIRNDSFALMETFTMQVGSPAGTVKSVEPVTNNLFNAGMQCSLASAGTSGSAVRAHFVLIFEYV